MPSGLGLGARIVILQPTERSMVAGSRPTAAQCSRRMPSLWASVSGVPKAFQMSAYWATIRSVFFSPLPPTMIGRCAWTGQRLDAQMIEGVATAGRTGHFVTVEQSPRRRGGFGKPVEPLPKPEPKSKPNARCSRLEPGAADAHDRAPAPDVVDRRQRP